MSPEDTLNAVSNILSMLHSLDLLYFFQNPVIESNDLHKMVTWPNHTPGAPHNNELAFSTFEQYCAILKEQSFHAILFDGAILRTSYTFRHDRLISHSLWFWPCPFSISPDDIKSETPLDAVYLYAVEWEKYVRFRSPIRFDYDPNNAVNPDHPSAHLHIQDKDCRIAVERPICFASFINFIFHNFYFDKWIKHDNVWNSFPHELLEENKSCLSPELSNSLHIGWKKNASR